LFLYTIFMYPDTVSSSVEELAESVSQNQLPIGYVLFLIALMMFMVMDRVIYLTSSKHAKTMYHYFTLVAVSVWVHNVCWSGSQEKGSLSCSMFFAVKSVSLALNARQIRCGYPERTRQHFLTQSTDLLARMSFLIYRAIPFLFEMRTLLDFSVTMSCLDLWDWLKLENINASLYMVAARNTVRNAKEFGDPQPAYMKLLTGWSLFVLLVALIWTPALLFSSGNPSIVANPVLSVGVNVTLEGVGGAQFPLFSGGMQRTIGAASWHEDLYKELGLASDQVQEICVGPSSDTLWALSPPAEAAFLTAAATNASLSLMWTWVRGRPAGNQRVEGGGGGGQRFVVVVDKAGEHREVARGERTEVRILG
jgi:hypothetical protein